MLGYYCDVGGGVCGAEGEGSGEAYHSGAENEEGWWVRGRCHGCSVEQVICGGSG